jgi:hypothetical protein
VHNDTDQERVVLLLRFWHPDLAGEETRVRAMEACWESEEQGGRLRALPPLGDAGLERRILGVDSCPGCGKHVGLEVEFAEDFRDVYDGTTRIVATCPSCGRVTTSPAQTPTIEWHLTTGTTVGLTGLTRGDLNGRRGFAVKYHEDKGRWAVRLLDEPDGEAGSVLLLKAINLLPTY